MSPDHRLLYRTVLVASGDYNAVTKLTGTLQDLGCFVAGPFSEFDDIDLLTDSCPDLAVLDDKLEVGVAHRVRTFLLEDRVPLLEIRFPGDSAEAAEPDWIEQVLQRLARAGSSLGRTEDV